jgi:hypothetical protein
MIHEAARRLRSDPEGTAHRSCRRLPADRQSKRTGAEIVLHGAQSKQATPAPWRAARAQPKS